DVNWTVSRRIITGFALAALLVVAIGAIGVWALRQTTSSYEEAVSSERELVLRSVQARGSIRNANVFYLRRLLENAPQHTTSRDSAVADARAMLTMLRDANAGDLRARWDEALSLLSEWDDATRRVIGLYTAGNEAAALSIREQDVQPL